MSDSIPIKKRITTLKRSIILQTFRILTCIVQFCEHNKRIFMDLIANEFLKRGARVTNFKLMQQTSIQTLAVGIFHRISSPFSISSLFSPLKSPLQFHLYKFKIKTTEWTNECYFPTNLSLDSTLLDFSDLFLASVFFLQWRHRLYCFLRFHWIIRCLLMHLIRCRPGVRLLFALEALSMEFDVLIWKNLGFLWAYRLDLTLQLLMHCLPIINLPMPFSFLVRLDLNWN